MAIDLTTIAVKYARARVCMYAGIVVCGCGDGYVSGHVCEHVCAVGGCVCVNLLGFVCAPSRVCE